jgi:NADH-quinone oxidoreductase subunit E
VTNGPARKPAAPGREAEDVAGFSDPARDLERIDVEEARRDAAEIPELHEVDCPPDLREAVEAAVTRYPDPRSASIPALWAVQRRYGWCSPEGMRQAAAVMGVPPAHLEAVATFYDLFRLEPGGRHEVLVCTNISCWMAGADELLEAVCESAGADRERATHEGSTSEDGEFFVSAFQCMGACDIAPMAAVDGRYVGPLSDGDAGRIVDALRSGTEALPEKSLSRRPAAGGPEPNPDPRVVGKPANGGRGSERA